MFLLPILCVSAEAIFVFGFHKLFFHYFSQIREIFIKQPYLLVTVKSTYTVSLCKFITICALKILLCTAAASKSLHSCPTLCDPIDGSPPGSPVPGVLQARTLEWVAISFSSAWKGEVKVKLLNPVTLPDPMDCSLPGSSAHEIF